MRLQDKQEAEARPALWWQPSSASTLIMPPEACGEAPPTLNCLSASIRARWSTRPDEVEPFPAWLTTFPRQVTRVSTLKRPSSSSTLHTCVEAPAPCRACTLTSSAYRTVRYCLCLTAAGFSPVPLWSAACCPHTHTHNTQPSVYSSAARSVRPLQRPPTHDCMMHTDLATGSAVAAK